MATVDQFDSDKNITSNNQEEEKSPCDPRVPPPKGYVCIRDPQNPNMGYLSKIIEADIDPS